MSTQPITQKEAAAAADLARLIRSRPEDVIDPYPPATEMEVLSDAGARGKEPETHAWVAMEGGRVVGYAAIDLSTVIRRAAVVGPVVHPDARRKGHGRDLLSKLIDQARGARQKRVDAMVGAANVAGIGLLRAGKFRERGRHTCFRMARPPTIPEFPDEGIRIRRANYDHAGEIHEFVSRFLPRSEKQTRSLLKSTDYAVVTAEEGGRILGVAEVDLRFGEVATVEHLDVDAAFEGKGLGQRILAEAIRAAFERRSIQALDLVVAGADAAQTAAYAEAGFVQRHELIEFERSL